MPEMSPVWAEKSDLSLFTQLGDLSPSYTSLKLADSKYHYHLLTYSMRGFARHFLQFYTVVHFDTLGPSWNFILTENLVSLSLKVGP